MAAGPEAKGGPSRAETRYCSRTRKYKACDSTHLLHLSSLPAVGSEVPLESLL
jgi:hypothetical protein